jgi:hypothetical protein
MDTELRLWWELVQAVHEHCRTHGWAVPDVLIIHLDDGTQCRLPLPPPGAVPAEYRSPPRRRGR